MRWFWTLTVLAFSAVPSFAADAVTFNKDIAPILWKNCTACHRTGEVGPFPLVTYQDAKKRATFIADVCESRQMPPWKPEPGYGTFHDERRLTDDQLARLRTWANNGTPEGIASDLPKMPTFPEGWQLGKPDLILSMPEAFTIPAEGRDILQCFVIPMNLADDTTIAAVEFRPGDRKVVHHAIFYLDSSGAARRRDEKEDGPGYRTFGGPGILPTGAIGGWAPGGDPRFLPDGIGKLIKKGSDLLLQIHYHPDGKEHKDQSMVGLYFTKKPAKQIMAGVALVTRKINIPAGVENHKITTQTPPLPADVDVIGIVPHMHYVGKSMRVWAELPDKKTVSLIYIKDWDFNWQGQYQLKSPIRLPKGTVLKLEAIYDNSSKNPRNPSDPPQLVTWGEQTTNEMCLCGVQVVTDTPEDLKKIVRSNVAGILFGGVSESTVDELIDPKKKAPELKLPPGGVPIPAQYADVLNIYDRNKDGKLTEPEIDAMPTALRDRVKKRIIEAMERK